MGRTLTRAEAQRMRAARNTAPEQMTTDAYMTRLARHIVAALEENPSLAGAELARAGRLRLRGEMTELAARSAAVRRERGA